MMYLASFLHRIAVRTGEDQRNLTILGRWNLQYSSVVNLEDHRQQVLEER